MGEVIVTSCKVSEIVNSALVGSDLALAFSTRGLPKFRVLCRYYITVTMVLDRYREMHASIKDALTLSVTFMFTQPSGGTVAVSPSLAARVRCVAVCANHISFIRKNTFITSKSNHDGLLDPS